jgi:hypothetical protein
MTDQPKHTPTPWLAEGKTVYALNENGTNRFSALVQAGFEFDGRRYKMPASPEEIEANAAFIVRACNSHDALVKVAKNLRDYLGEGRKLGDDTEWFADKVSAALKLAEG